MSAFIKTLQYRAVIFITAIGAISLLNISINYEKETNLGTMLFPDAQEGEIFLSSCDIFLEGDDRSYKGDCGTLIVRENRYVPNSRLIPLPVRRVKALGNHVAEPIFWFEGGPGGPNVMTYPTDGLLNNHDFIMVGYRGIEGEVNIVCGEIANAVRAAKGNLLSDEALDSYAQAASECSQRYISNGIDLTGYTMNHTIDDMELARNAFGYDKINLYGNSYGTRLELLYQWYYPNSLNRVVQVAVNPPGHFVFYPEAIEKQLRNYSALCAADEYCSSRTSNLYETIEYALNNLPSHWMGISIDPDKLRLITMVSFMESIEVPDEIFPLNGPAVIDMWLDAAEGNLSGLVTASLLMSHALPSLTARGHKLAMGASAPDFHDKTKDYRNKLSVNETLLGSPFSLMDAAMIEGWIASDDQAVGEIVSSQVETLLINGSIDGSTPMQFARDELLPYLTNGHLFVLRDQGHTETFWNSQPTARARILNEFFDHGNIDGSLYKYQSPVFEVETSWEKIGKTLMLIVGIGILAIVLLMGWSIKMICSRT